MEKRRINKLMIPFVKRTLSLVSAVTIMTTSMAGCGDKDQTKDPNKDISTPTDSISSKPEENTISIITESSTNSSSKENQTSTKPSTGSTSSNTESSKKPTSSSSSSKNPTNSQNSSSSKKPSSSSSSSNKNETMPSKLTASNINDVEVFKHFANKLNKESFPGVPIFRYGYSYNGKTYKTDGEKEFELFLTMLNYDSLNSSLLQQLFSNTDQETLKRYSFFMHTIINVITEKQIVYNFDKYMVDQGLGNFIKTYQQEYIKLLKGNSNKFKEMAIDYYINKSGAYHYGKANDFVEYFMFWLTKSGMDYDFSAKLDVKFVELEGKIEDNYDVSFVIVYNKASGKAKVLH